MARRLTRLAVESFGIAQGTVSPLAQVSNLPQVMGPDWSRGVEISTQWLTAITSAKLTLTEERLGRRARPLRTMKFNVLELDQERAAEMQFWRLRLGNGRSHMPLFMDASSVEIPAGTTESFVNCDTADRRFYVGQRVGFVPAQFRDISIGNGQFRQIQYAFIASIESNGLSLVGTLDYAINVGDFVFPMMDIEPVLKTRGTLHTQFYADAEISVSEVAGASTLPPSWLGPMDSEFVLFDDPGVPGVGLPVVDLNHDWGKRTVISIVRQGKRGGQGNAPYTVVDGPRPAWRFDLPMTDLSRKEGFDTLRLHDSLKGRQKTCFVLNPQTMWDVIGIGTEVDGSGYVDVRPYGYFRDALQFLSYISLVQANGEILTQAIRSVTQPSTDRYRILSPVPWTLGSALIRATSTHLCRLDSDNLKQTWITDTVSQSSLSFVEVIGENEV